MEMNMVKIFSQEMNRFVLIPSYPSDEEKFKAVGEGEIKKWKYTEPRNIKLHNKFMALCRLLTEQCEDFSPINDTAQARESAVEVAKKAILMEIGFTEYVHRLSDDKMVPIPKSINFDSVDQSDFAIHVYSPACIVVAKKLGITTDDIEQNIVFNM